MKPLYMIELQPDLTALLRFLHNQGLTNKNNDENLGYGVHAWLGAAFDKLSPKPWRLLLDKRRPPRVLAYSHHSAKELQQHMCEFADPSTYAICPPEAIASRVMPVWRSGRRLAFDLQCCPVGRKANSGIEKDIFLMHADSREDEKLSRETVYCNWVSEQLHRNQAVTVDMIQLVGFRLIRQMRQGMNNSPQRKLSYLIRPHALLQGEFIVEDPDAFTNLLARGVGRHRSFGYGMLLLRPPA